MPNSMTPLSDRDRVFYITEWVTRWRAAAILFALGATFIGAVCFLIALYPPLALILLPGYLVTIGYHWRAWGNPSRKWTRAIWSFSLFVQGAWLLLAVVGLVRSGGPSPLYNPVMYWWLVTTVVSAVGISKDDGSLAAA